jgi:hypothetical protein
MMSIIIINRTLGGGIEYIDYFELKYTERLSGSTPVLTSGSSPAEVFRKEKSTPADVSIMWLPSSDLMYLRYCGDGGWGVNKFGIVGEGNASRENGQENHPRLGV